jgi:SanA protein
MAFTRGIRLFLAIFLFVSIFLALISFYVRVKGESFIVHASEARASVVIVLGAGLKPDNTPSNVLRDRLMVALALYNEGRVEKILCSGDNGQIQYDEVNAMRVWLIERKVDADDIFLDHAGFDTYDTVTRAAEIFGVTNAVIVTQDFHLPRALYIAQAKGIKAQGVSASLEQYIAQDAYRIREIPSRIKAFFEVLFHVSPKYLGNAIEVMGDGRVTWDEGL